MLRAQALAIAALCLSATLARAQSDEGPVVDPAPSGREETVRTVEHDTGIIVDRPGADAEHRGTRTDHDFSSGWSGNSDPNDTTVEHTTSADRDSGSDSESASDGEGGENDSSEGEDSSSDE